MTGDITEENTIKKIVQTAKDVFGTLHVIVSCMFGTLDVMRSVFVAQVEALLNEPVRPVLVIFHN